MCGEPFPVQMRIFGTARTQPRVPISGIVIVPDPVTPPGAVVPEEALEHILPRNPNVEIGAVLVKHGVIVPYGREYTKVTK